MKRRRLLSAALASTAFLAYAGTLDHPLIWDDLRLRSTVERLAFLGGLLKVQSKPGEGTTIRIVVPRDRLR